jgi:hypothetical protein
MGPFKVLCLFLFLLGYISTIIAVPINSDPTPPTKNAFHKPLFNVKQGPSTASGCDSRLSILAEAYTEAIKMVDQAVQVLNYINEPGPEADNPAQWSIDEYFVLSMFRIQMDYKTGEVIPPDNTNLRNDADGLKRAQGKASLNHRDPSQKGAQRSHSLKTCSISFSTMHTKQVRPTVSKNTWLAQTTPSNTSTPPTNIH